MDVDNIEQNVTTWYFEDGIFTLDNGNTYEYSTHGSGSRTQYRLLGIPPYGSARSLGILDFPLFLSLKCIGASIKFALSFFINHTNLTPKL